MKDAVGETEVLREAFASLGETARPNDECPQPEHLWDGVRGELDASQLRELVEHTASCAACAEAWRLAVEIGGEVPASVETADAARIAAVAPVAARPVRPVRRLAWSVAAAAAVVLGAVGIGRLVVPGEAPPTTYRTASQEALTAAVAEGEALPRDAFLLRWNLSPAPAGVRYHLEVTDDELRELVSERNLESPSFLVPAAALAGLEPGAQVLWRVEAVRADGTSIDEASFLTRVE